MKKAHPAVAAMADQTNRPHRKGKEKKAHSGGPNPKAFALAAPGRAAKQGARSQDVCTIVLPSKEIANGNRSEKSASTSRSSTACPKKRPRSSWLSLVPLASARPL